MNKRHCNYCDRALEEGETFYWASVYITKNGQPYGTEKQVDVVDFCVSCYRERVGSKIC